MGKIQERVLKVIAAYDKISADKVIKINVSLFFCSHLRVVGKIKLKQEVTVKRNPWPFNLSQTVFCWFSNYMTKLIQKRSVHFANDIQTTIVQFTPINKNYFFFLFGFLVVIGLTFHQRLGLGFFGPCWSYHGNGGRIWFWNSRHGCRKVVKAPRCCSICGRQRGYLRVISDEIRQLNFTS